jgi:hypothetical protein
MRFAIRIAGVGFSCVAVALGVVAWMTGLNWWPKTPEGTRSVPDVIAARTDSDVRTFPDANAPGTGRQIFIDRGLIEDEIVDTALAYTGSVRDPKSLEEMREAIRGRGRRGIADLRSKYERLPMSKSPTIEQLSAALPMARSIAYLFMYDGKFAEAATWLERGLELSRAPGVSPDVEANLHALLGITALRRGEIENCLECVGSSSCIFPINLQGAHRQQAGSLEAIKHFKAYLEWSPGDLRIRWLLNLCYMTLSEFPSQVPPAFLVPSDSFRSMIKVGSFENVANAVGLGARGPNLAGGSIFDDFDGDGRPDVLTTSTDADLGASLFINRGDGTFEDRSSAAGLSQQIYALNLARADFDNDGNPDVVLLRGAWEKPRRLSLLRNKGNAVFEDVTFASGLGEPIPTESAVWGDYDNDGLVDLFVCGEYQGKEAKPSDRSRLYHNQGDGTFQDVAALAGIVNEHMAKGSAWGDYDSDGRLDLFISNLDGPCRLYHNEGDGRFRDVARELGLTGPAYNRSFSCWFWDYDNDGRLDLLVNDYHAALAEVLANTMGLDVPDCGHPRLYRNEGAQGFRNVSKEVGLDRPIPAMGANFGDIDNDGYLDAYFGTGWMAYSGLIPNVMLKNVEGRRFEDVTDSSRTGHLQKGHGVSFADWDNDGDVDLFVVLGGGYPGDQSYNALFANPGNKHHWLKVKLVGTKTNRSAFGARIKVDLTGADGAARSIYRVIGNNGSFGGNSLVETIGLSDATHVTELTVSWPTSHTTQNFRDLAADQAIEITEGSDSVKILTQMPLRLPEQTR